MQIAFDFHSKHYEKWLWFPSKTYEFWIIVYFKHVEWANSDFGCELHLPMKFYYFIIPDCISHGELKPHILHLHCIAQTIDEWCGNVAMWHANRFISWFIRFDDKLTCHLAFVTIYGIHSTMPWRFIRLSELNISFINRICIFNGSAGNEICATVRSCENGVSWNADSVMI